MRFYLNMRIVINPITAGRILTFRVSLKLSYVNLLLRRRMLRNKLKCTKGRIRGNYELFIIQFNIICSVIRLQLK